MSYKIVWRHARTEYGQGKVPLLQAEDITEEGEKTLIKVVDSVVPYLQDQPNIVSSKYGRCGKTARVIKKELSDRGIESLIVLDDGLSEVEFDFETFSKAVQGGDYNGTYIDPKITNPDNLTLEGYFHTDAIHNLSNAILDHLPIEYVEKIESFDTCKESCDRLEESIANYKPNSIFVTHEGLTWNFLERSGMSPEEYLLRGHFLVLSEEDDFKVPVHYSQFEED